MHVINGLPYELSMILRAIWLFLFIKTLPGSKLELVACCLFRRSDNKQYMTSG